MMFLALHTRGRTGAQTTYENLPYSLKLAVNVVCPPSESAVLQRRWGMKVLSRPEHIHSISAARQWVLSQFGGTFPAICFMDDDLRFGCRRADDLAKFSKAAPEDLLQMFHAIEDQLHTHPMVGICARERGHLFAGRGPVVLNQRMSRIWAIRTDFFRAHQIRLDEFTLMDDFHAALSVLAGGEDTACLTSWCHDQGGSQAKGGCALYRNAATQQAEAELLAARHRPFVALVTKRSKNWGAELSERTDVRVAWAQAARSGKRKEQPIASEFDETPDHDEAQELRLDL